MLSFAQAFATVPASPGWTSNTTVPACSWGGVICRPLAAGGTLFFNIDLDHQPALSGALCWVLGCLMYGPCIHLWHWQRAGSIQASWASLPSFTEGLLSLNLSKTNLQASCGFLECRAVIWQCMTVTRLQGSVLPDNFTTFTSLQSLNFSGNLINGDSQCC